MHKVLSTVVSDEWRDLAVLWLKVRRYGVKPGTLFASYEAMIKQVTRRGTMPPRYRKAKSVLLAAIAAKIRLTDRQGRLVSRGWVERELKKRTR